VEQVDHGEWGQLMNRVKRECQTRALDMLGVLVKVDVSDPRDTIYVKDIKRGIPPTDERFRQYLYSRYSNETIRLQNDFEQFFLRLSVSQQFDDIRKRIVNHQGIIRSKLLSVLHRKSIPVDENFFKEELFREQMQIDESNRDYCALKSYEVDFDDALRAFQVVDPRFQEFLLLRREFIAMQQAALERLDELSLGWKFFVLAEVFRSVDLLCEKRREWSHGLLCEVLAGGKYMTLLATFLAILHFAGTQKPLVNSLSEETTTALRELRIFFQEIVERDPGFTPGTKSAFRAFVE
jgi:hypothetical protein